MLEVVNTVLDFQRGEVDGHLPLLRLLGFLLGLRGLQAPGGIGILAAVALAGLGAGDPRVVALAVALEAVGLLAVAAFFGQGAVPEAALLDSALGHGYFFLELQRVLATEAGTVLAALPPRGEALAVHLETEGLLAGAADFLLLRRVGSGGHPRDAFGERVVLGRRRTVLEGQVEVIEREVIGDGVDGVDHLEALVEIGELLHRGQVKERQLAGLLLHAAVIILISIPKHQYCPFYPGRCQHQLASPALKNENKAPRSIIGKQ